MHTWLGLSVVALVFWGLSGVTQKLSTNHISFERSFVWFCVAFLAQALIVAGTVPLAWDLPLPLIAFGALGGCLNGAGALTSFAALARGGKASVVIPLISLYPLLTIAGAWILLGERLTIRQGSGIVCAVVAVILLSQESTRARPD